MEDGSHRNYNVDTIPRDAAGINERYPRGFSALQQSMGYRVRPSWVRQRKRYGSSEVIVAIANDGVSGVPGVLRLSLESMDGKFRMSGGLDAGHPYGGRLREASFVAPREISGQRFRLRAEIETRGVRRPVQWACEQPLDPDGTFLIELQPHSAPGWRKGV